MADELQALLDKIDREGIQKGEAAAQRLISKAEADAAAIIAKAQSEAAELKRAALSENATMKEKSELALRQAAREVLLELRCQLEKRVSSAVGSLLKATMTPGAIAPVIASLCENYLKNAGNNGSIEVLVSAEQLATLENAVKATLADSLRGNLSFAPNRYLAAGFKLIFKGEDVMYDFSDEALCEAIASHISPALTAILTEEKK